MTQLFANSARAELAADINNTDLTLTIVSGGALFPVANTGAAAISAAADWFKLVLQDASGIEIVYVRTHTASSLSFSDVLRGQEGTTARGFLAASIVGIRPTAGDAASLSVWGSVVPGTGVAAALAIAVGTAGSFLVQDAAASVSTLSSSGDITRSAAAGTTRTINVQTAGVHRWRFGASNGAESGSNAGSDFQIYGYSDAGSFLGTWFSIARATGVVSIGSAAVSGTLSAGVTTVSGGSAGTTTVLQKIAAPRTFTNAADGLTLAFIASNGALGSHDFGAIWAGNNTAVSGGGDAVVELRVGGSSSTGGLGSANAFLRAVGAAGVTSTTIYGAVTIPINASIGSSSTNNAYWANGDAYSLLLHSNQGGAGSGGQLLFSGLGLGTPFAGIKGYATNGTGPSGDLVFQTRSTTGNIIERMRISGTGAVTIPVSLSDGITPSIKGSHDTSGSLTTSAGTRLIFGDGTSASPTTTTAYHKPDLYLERHTATTSYAPTSLWGNLRKSGTQNIHTAAYAGEIGEVCGINVLTRNISADGTTPNAIMVGVSAMADSSPAANSGKKHPQIWGGNFVARFATQAGWVKPQDCVGIEIDVINEEQSDGVVPSSSGAQTTTNYTGVWANAAGSANMVANTAYLATSSGGTNVGWNHGFVANGRFTKNLAYLKTSENAATAKGLYVETTYAASTGTIIEAAVAGITKFKVDGQSGGVLGGVWVYLNGALKELLVGASDSGGAGYRLVRVAN